ncbi:hypothetical protein HDU98_009416 [Podochytrium sp. JEL0797]|nr:hypothetical protein HDU98_009416 [Podochytrium sp. JEL0797]
MTRTTALPTSVVRDPQPSAKTQAAPLAQKPKPQTPKPTTQSASLLPTSKGKENYSTANAGRTPPVLHSKSVNGKVSIQNAFGLKDAGSINSSAKSSRSGSAVPPQKIVSSHQPDWYESRDSMPELIDIDDDDLWYMQHLFGDSNSTASPAKAKTASNPPLPAKANNNIKSKPQPKPQSQSVKPAPKVVQKRHESPQSQKRASKKPLSHEEEAEISHFVTNLFDNSRHIHVWRKPQKLTTEERNEIQHFVNHLFDPEVPAKKAVVKKPVYDPSKTHKIHYLRKVEKENARRAVFEIWAAAKPGWGTSRHQNGPYPKGERCQRKRRNRQAKKEARARKAARSRYGYIHDVVDKHDKPDRKTRCKKCSDCNICSGSGIVVGKTVCGKCKARGFLHPSGAKNKHPPNELISCIECVECKDCVKGIPHHLAKHYPKAEVVMNQGERPKSTLVGSSPMFESLFGSDSAHYQGNKKSTQQKHQTAQQTLVNVTGGDNFSEIVKKMIDCPRCTARGWKHESTAKHERNEKTRCKNCVNCKACLGKGKVQENRTPCTDCNLAGFIHPATDTRPHDAPDNLRCFYCQICQSCNGLGVKTIKLQKSPQKPPPPLPPLINPLTGLPMPPPTGMPSAQQPRQQQPPPNIPAPPMLKVVMVVSPENPDVQIPMVEVPGIGLVPAEQIMKMSVPMVVMPTISPPRPPASPAGQAQQPQEKVVDEQELMETNHVLKDVWG